MVQVGGSLTLPISYCPPAGHSGLVRTYNAGPNRSPSRGRTPKPFRFSIAHWALASSICRRLRMHRVCAERARDWANAGMAITASNPITPTTIMISTRVKPAFATCCAFIIIKLTSSLLFRADSQPAFVLGFDSITGQRMRGGHKSDYPGHTRDVESKNLLGCRVFALRGVGDSYATVALRYETGRELASVTLGSRSRMASKREDAGEM